MIQCVAFVLKLYCGPRCFPRPEVPEGAFLAYLHPRPPGLDRGALTIHTLAVLDLSPQSSSPNAVSVEPQGRAGSTFRGSAAAARLELLRALNCAPLALSELS